MPSPDAKKVQLMDTATTVLAIMRQRGIAGLPRNYELVYEAMNGSNATLTRDLEALGNAPGQDVLDVLGKRYFTHHHRTGVVESAHDRISGELEGMVRLLKQEQASLETYSKLLDRTYSQISTKSATSAEILAGIIKLLSSATGDTMEKGRNVVDDMAHHTSEIEQVRRELDEYKRIANTDPLTRLANRRAFDEVLSSVYNDTRESMYYGLIVCDIDHFKKFNDSFGHPVGDRVLNVIATVMKNALRKDIFIARTGGEEFAVIIGGASLETTLEVSERLRKSVAETPLKNQKTGIDYGPVTMSIGICMASEAIGATDLYNKADMALYCAKSRGRNSIEVYRAENAAEMEKDWLIYKR